MTLIYIGVLTAVAQNQNLTCKFEFSVSSASLLLGRPVSAFPPFLTS